jgi:hypothetical protein
MIEHLNDDNFVTYAMRHYDNPQCHSVAEFEEDLRKFLYLKKLFSRYKKTGELSERLILNHLIVIYNLFGVEAATRMLYYKIEDEHWATLTTFLAFLNYMPETIPDTSLKTSDVKLDETAIKVLRKI